MVRPYRTVGFFALMALLVVVCVACCADTVAITPDNYTATGWTIATQTGTSTGAPIAAFVGGFGGAPEGLGSIHMKTFYSDADPLSKIYIGTSNFTGTPLAQMTSFKYYTYLRSRDYGTSGQPNGQPPMIELITDSGTTLQERRFVYKPYGEWGNNNVMLGMWQEWDLMAANGRWELLNTGSSNYFGNWDWVVNRYAGLKLRDPLVGDNYGYTPDNLTTYNISGTSLSIKIGSPKAQDSRYGAWWRESCGIDGCVDRLVIGVNGVETVYDFEPGPRPIVHIGNRDVSTPAARLGSNAFWYAISGNFTMVGPDTLFVDDGSGTYIKVVSKNHGIGDVFGYLRAWGYLDTVSDPAQPILYGVPGSVLQYTVP